MASAQDLASKMYSEADVDSAISNALSQTSREEQDSILDNILLALSPASAGGFSSSDEPLNSIALSIVPALFPLATSKHGSTPARAILGLIASHSSPREVLLALDECLQPNHPSQDSSDPPSMLDRLTTALPLYTACLPRVPIRKRGPTAILEPVMDIIRKALPSALRQTEEQEAEMISRCLITLVDLIGTISRWSTDWYSKNDSEHLSEAKNQLETFILKCTFSLAPQIQIFTKFPQNAFYLAFPHYAFHGTIAESKSDITADSVNSAVEKMILIWAEISTRKSFDVPTEVTTDTLLLLPSLVLALESWNISRRSAASFSVDSAPSDNRNGTKTQESSQNLSSKFASIPPLPRLTDRLINVLLVPSLTQTVCVEHIVGFLALSAKEEHGSSEIRDEDGLTDVGRYALVDSLAPIAATHTDPSIRHIALRMMELYIINGIQDDRIRQTILTDLITESPFPQMQNATIGILRGVVTKSLKPTSSHSSPQAMSPSSSLFISSELLKTFAPIVFQIRPKGLLDAFSESADAISDTNTVRTFVTAFAESPEPARLMEALNLYLVLLVGDRENKTEIRSRYWLDKAEEDLIGPLRSALIKWQDVDDHDIEEIMRTALAGLCMAMQRVDTRLEQLS